MRNVITHLLLMGACTVIPLRGQPDALSTPAPASLPTPERRVIEQNGLTFVLLRSTRNEGVDTEEYFLQNEGVDHWSQMLTYQRIVLPEPMGTDRYVGRLKSHLEQKTNAPHFKTVQLGKEASIFGVQYPVDASSEEQFGIALATIPDARRPNELHLIQYLLQTRRVPVEVMELQVKRWQARFQSEAASLLRGDAASHGMVP